MGGSLSFLLESGYASCFINFFTALQHTCFTKIWKSELSIFTQKLDLPYFTNAQEMDNLILIVDLENCG